MSLRDKLRRYFRGNTASIFYITWIGHSYSYTPWRCANARGFYWLGFQVGWRVPYFEGFSWNPINRRWEVPLSYPSPQDTIQ